MILVITISFKDNWYSVDVSHTHADTLINEILCTGHRSKNKGALL